MKAFFSTSALLVLALLVLQGCDRDGRLDALTDETNNPENLLLATRVTTPPTLDGVADEALWTQAEPVFFSTGVVDIPAFQGYGGRQYQVEMKAAYDDQNVYFLVRYNDDQRDVARQSWYVDPVTGLWAQEDRHPLFDEDGAMIRKAFYEDKLSLMWEATPVEGFATSGCAVACHTGLSPFQSSGGKSALKYTNRFGEVLDMWHLKYVRSAGTEIPHMDDQYTNWTSTAKNGGRHSDEGKGSYVDNKQTLDGKAVPLYVLKDATEPYYWITPDQISLGDALKVTGVQANGDLVLEDGTVIPASDPRYQRDGALDPPSVYTRQPEGDRADINARAVFSNGFWTIEIKRARVTGSDVDVQFDDLTKDYPFGAAVFDNAAIAHATSNAPIFLRFQ